MMSPSFEVEHGHRPRIRLRSVSKTEWGHAVTNGGWHFQISGNIGPKSRPDCLSPGLSIAVPEGGFPEWIGIPVSDAYRLWISESPG
jgi:hypothetical protein